MKLNQLSLLFAGELVSALALQEISTSIPRILINIRETDERIHSLRVFASIANVIKMFRDLPNFATWTVSKPHGQILESFGNLLTFSVKLKLKPTLLLFGCGSISVGLALEKST
ncbi:hypothetical protein AVEN_5099-1 [Araneus ventricosus]|uniref:Uncharacterized protein n=1 Tax=Araneus ventricosus TaxID=182803 RepID=A0A4Y2MIS5_ARAVE|nr:hypothetical protein AVEN_5099-1 [Araneus ventricosus]